MFFSYKYWIKCKLILAVFIMAFLQTRAQTPTFQWVKTFGSVQQDHITDMAIDNNGFIYILGTYSDSLNSDPVDALFPVLNDVLLFNADSNQIINFGQGFTQVFFAKFNPQGNAIWVKNVGTLSADFSGALVVDKAGNIIISGNCYGNINLNPADSVTQFVASGNIAGFLGKYDSNGNLLWKTLFDYIDIPPGPGETPYVRNFLFSEIACTSDNQLMIAGFVSGNFIVVHNEVAVDTIYPGSYKGMLMKVNEYGLPVFENYLKIIGPIPFVLNVAAIAINSNDEVVITGSFMDTLEVVIGNPAATLIQPDYAFAQRMFFAKFSSNASFIWAKAIEGYPYTQANDIIFDAYDNMYVTGLVGPQPNAIFTIPLTDFDPDTSTYEIPRNTFNASEKSAFIASYTNNGAIRWANWLYGADYDTHSGGEVDGKELAIDCAGRVYMSGTTRCEIADANPAAPIVPVTPGVNAWNSPPNPFILRYTSDGDYLSQRIFYSEEGTAQINAMVSDTNGLLFTAGYFTHSFQFNYTNTLTNTSLNSDTTLWFYPAAQDMFLTKHETCINRTYTNNQICAGDSFLYNGYWLKNTGVYPKLVSTNGNCENVEVLNLLVAPVQATSQTINLCTGETFSIGNQTFTQSGIYQTSLTAQNGCDSLVTSNLIVDTLDAEIELIENVFTALNLPPNAQLQWLNCEENLVEILGENNATFTVSAAGLYAVEILSGNCRDTSECVVFTSVGINNQTQKEYRIYPNPADRKLFFENQFLNTAIKIIDLQGRLILETKTSSKLHEIDVSSFSNGIYFLQTNNKVKIITIQHTGL